MITSIKKRDGRIVPFDQEKIEQAIEKSFMASGSQKSQETAQSGRRRRSGNRAG